MAQKNSFHAKVHILKSGFDMGKTHMVIGLLVILFLMLWAPPACNPGNQSAVQSQPQTAVVAQENRALDGGTLLAERCSTCHGTNKVRQTRKTSEGWDKTVSRMMTKGARLAEGKKTFLLDFLLKHYGL